jgi:glutamate/tyrosine decarboxylase-like PLP-dependent enzyme
VVWSSADYLPDDLIFLVSYLGGSMPTFALNFSRPGAQVLMQYYNFLRLSREGYQAVQRASHDVARHLADEIVKLAPFELWGDDMTSPCSRGGSSMATPTSGTCTTSGTSCGSAGGSCPHTRCPTTSPT